MRAVLAMRALQLQACAGRVDADSESEGRMRIPLIKVNALMALLVLLSACASAPPAQNPISQNPSAQNLLGETDDLAMISNHALQLAERYGKDQVLVVFDVDNTLLAMEQGLGSDQWYDWQKELQNEDPCSDMLVSDRLAVQGALYFASAMRPTQPDAAYQLRLLQDAGLTVIVLTSRGADFRLQTFRELRRNGFSLWSNALAPKRGYPEPFIPEGGSRPALYEDGVFLTAGQHKGDMLKALLDKTGTDYPTVVVMADDKERHLRAVLETFAGSGTSVHAWRYSREDAAVASLDHTAADAKWDSVKPALRKIQQVMGPDNFDFPEHVVPEGCGSRSD